MATIFEKVKSCILVSSSSTARVGQWLIVEQFLLVCQILYAFAIALTKVAIILSYLRFIQDHTFRMIMFTTLFVTIALWICGIFVPIFQCKPISGAWNFTAQGSCINYIDYLYASSAVNVFTDIVLCATPTPHLWRLSKSALDVLESTR